MKIIDKIRTTNKLFLIAAFVVVFVFLSANLTAQYSYSKYIYVEEQKSFMQLLFSTNKNKNSNKSISKKSKKQSEKTKVENDTTKPKNRIESLRDGGDIFYLYLVLSDRDSPIKITVYNMLGKEVLDVYNGYPKPNGVPYEINISGPPSLPNGVYLCVVIGKNFRLREKFVVARG